MPNAFKWSVLRDRNRANTCKQPGLDGGRLCPVDRGLDGGGDEIGRVASDGSDSARIGCHPCWIILKLLLCFF